MDLRSSSAPILNSWLSHSKEPPTEPELEPILHLSRTRSVSLTSSIHSPPIYLTKKTKPTQVLLESDLQNPQKPKKKKPISKSLIKQSKNRARKGDEQEEEMKLRSEFSSSSTKILFSSSGLDEKLMDGVGKKDSVLQTLVVGGVGSNGGKICGGGTGKGSDGGDGEGSDFFESNNHGNGSTEAYFQKIIEADPGNALLLGNYAKFLKEVRGDYAKAEEYCGRAILAGPSDADTLSLYGDLIWTTEKDAERAENYFDQAVKTSPDDCYVLASYARFLWDAEEEDDEESEGAQHETDRSHASSSNFFHGDGAHHHDSPLNAAS